MLYGYFLKQQPFSGLSEDMFAICRKTIMETTFSFLKLDKWIFFRVDPTRAHFLAIKFTIWQNYHLLQKEVLESRKQLANIRVVQKNLIHLTGSEFNIKFGI
ncbi:hypothetical protein TNCT_695621 [Trichonephila clavata]|uniref:Uncharacterized protein n=1 Tax=Trichonephila clavata TaxID=2740835 RepID=A0A8X6H6N7_TRICU|nr:hypothetical protein TNCT_695621 [Trichonephila clavata]